jgi:uncharacterized protein YwqG
MQFAEPEFVLGDDLSPALHQLLTQNQKAVAATLQPFVKIHFSPQPQLTAWQSKIGGTPYLPQGFAYPLGAEGQPLQFLAQLNFTEIPPLPKFPTSGILQFYISPDEDLYGANFDELEERENFRVLYFAEVLSDASQLVTDFSFLPEFDNSPLAGAAALTFTPAWAPISGGDYRFEESLGEIFAEVDDDELRWEYHEKVGNAEGHHLGGYPGFTQEDPRVYQEEYRIYDCLLLQFDSEHATGETGGEVDLMWGDSGIANFFITSAALEKLDFSEVLFNWDCC